jgi:RNA polymerase sigma-70 factor (ECF subfamily)
MASNPSSGEPVVQLMERWHAGDDREEVFRALFEKFYGPLYRFFTRRAFSPEEAQDLIQETFLRVYRGIASFRQEAKWENWLFQIASNTASKAWRHRSAKKRSGFEVPLDVDADGEPAAELDAELSASSSAAPALRQVLAREGAELLRQAIEELPPQMRRCVRLRVFQDLEHAEIGQLMQIAPATVKVQLFKARKRLQEALGEHFQDFDF